MRLSKNLFPIFFYLGLLTFVFLLAEISFFIQSTQIYFHDFKFISHHIAVPIKIFPGIVFFVFAQLFLHFCYCLAIGIIAITVIDHFKLKNEIKVSVSLWLLGIITIFVANQYYFPNSKFSELTRFIFPDELIGLLLGILGLLCASIVAIFIWASFRKLPRRYTAYFIITMISYLGYNYLSLQTHHINAAASPQKPNIIIIGIDSVRPDFLSFFGGNVATPFLDSVLSKSTVFSNAYTPLARTFPSWISILSGKYPKESGIRFNLAQANNQNMALLLPNLLHEQGYKTIYATDEVRFSNIDQKFGFDEAIIPPIGLNDFLLGTFNDFPLSNLFINSKIGEWLFPYSYANRSAFITYNPNSFLSRINSSLQQKQDKPLFLAIHFCLPHYPYLWSQYSGVKDEKALSRYKAAIIQADKQVKSLLDILENQQILNHALVVLLSDHGEALELDGDRVTAAKTYITDRHSTKMPRFYPPSADDEAVNQSAGHGTDVLGLTQYRTLLAVRLYGLGNQAIKIDQEPVLTLDIAPTLLAFLNIKSNSTGVSLRDQIITKQQSKLPKSRIIFLESDFSPQAIRSVHPETRNLVFEGIEFFRIDPATTRILVKDSMAKLIISSKQYAALEQGWILALYPRPDEKMTPVLVNLSTGEWTTDLSTAFAKNSPHRHLLSALKSFYGKEISQIITP